jgi:uncharacterized protein YqfA (UPF0365 family)
MTGEIGLVVLFGLIGLVIVLFFSFVPVGLWISSLAANVKVSIFNLVGMKLRRVSPSKIVLPLIKAIKAGLDLNVNQLEAHYLAGGNIDGVINALIAAERAGIELPFEKAAAISETAKQEAKKSPAQRHCNLRQKCQKTAEADWRCQCHRS